MVVNCFLVFFSLKMAQNTESGFKIVMLNIRSAEALSQSGLFCKALPCFDRQAEPVMITST